jgi:hypothetical protein
VSPVGVKRWVIGEDLSSADDGAEVPAHSDKMNSTVGFLGELHAKGKRQFRTFCRRHGFQQIHEKFVAGQDTPPTVSQSRPACPQPAPEKQARIRFSETGTKVRIQRYCELFVEGDLDSVTSEAGIYSFFYHSLPEEGVLSLDDLHALVKDIWLTRHDAELEEERSARRKGRPKSAKETKIEELKLREIEEYRTGMGTPLTAESCLSVHALFCRHSGPHASRNHPAIPSLGPKGTRLHSVASVHSNIS